MDCKIFTLIRAILFVSPRHITREDGFSIPKCLTSLAILIFLPLPIFCFLTWSDLNTTIDIATTEFWSTYHPKEWYQILLTYYLVYVGPYVYILLTVFALYIAVLGKNYSQRIAAAFQCAIITSMVPFLVGWTFAKIVPDFVWHLIAWEYLPFFLMKYQHFDLVCWRILPIVLHSLGTILLLLGIYRGLTVIRKMKQSC